MITTLSIFKKPSLFTKLFNDEESSILKKVSGIKIADFYVQRIENNILICSEKISSNEANEYKKIHRGDIVTLLQKHNAPLQGSVLKTTIYESIFEITIHLDLEQDQIPRNLIARIII